MLQAFDTGVDASGRHTFNIILDGMDSTDELVPSAFFGVLSEWQCRLVQLFVNYQRLQYPDKGCLFFNTGHFPLQDLSKKNWKEFGWQDYFSQADVAPLEFAGHRHTRAFIDETKRSFFGFPIPIGTPSIKRKAAYSFVAPSMTDNLEFMSSESTVNPLTDKLDLTIRYHQVVPDNYDFDPEVIAKVDSLKEYYRENRYREYSEMDHDFFTRAYNVFFTDQQGILAFDAIPISVGQYNEMVLFTKSWVELLKMDLGENDPEQIAAAKQREEELNAGLVALLKLNGIDPKTMYHSDFDKDLVEFKNTGANPAEINVIFEAWQKWQAAKEDLFNLQFVGRVEKTLAALESRQKEWLAKYTDAKASVVGLPRADQIHELAKFNDIFDTPYYELLRFLIAETPRTDENSRAYISGGKPDLSAKTD